MKEMVDHPHVIVELIPSRAIQKNPMLKDSFRAVPVIRVINPEFPTIINRPKETDIIQNNEQIDQTFVINFTNFVV